MVRPLMYLPQQLWYRAIDSFQLSKEKGMRAALTELGKTGARILYQHADYVILTHTLSVPATTAQPSSGLAIRRATTRDAISTLSLTSGSADMARFYKLYEAGSHALIATNHGQIAGYCWASQGVDGSVNRVQAALPSYPGDAYVHDLFVSPTHRRQGVGQALLIHCLEYLHKSGYKRALAAVAKDNIPSLTLTRNTGYIVIGELSHMRILFWGHFKCRIFDL